MQTLLFAEVFPPYIDLLLDGIRAIQNFIGCCFNAYILAYI